MTRFAYPFWHRIRQLIAHSEANRPTVAAHSPRPQAIAISLPIEAHKTKIEIIKTQPSPYNKLMREDREAPVRTVSKNFRAKARRQDMNKAAPAKTRASGADQTRAAHKEAPTKKAAIVITAPAFTAGDSHLNPLTSAFILR
jgi:hypothetical protein